MKPRSGTDKGRIAPRSSGGAPSEIRKALPILGAAAVPRAENESLTKAPSFASFLVFGDSPASPVTVAATAENPFAHLAGKSSLVLLAEFPSPWRIVAETPKSHGWWKLLKKLEHVLSII